MLFEYPAPPPMLDGTDVLGRPIDVSGRVQPSAPIELVTYGQPMGSARLDSIAAARLTCPKYRAEPAQTLFPAFSDSSRDMPPLRWLLAADQKVLGVAESAHCVIDLNSAKSCFAAGSTSAWAMLSPDGRTYFVRLGETVVERTMDWRAGSHHQRTCRARWLDEATPVCAMALVSEDGTRSERGDMLLATSRKTHGGSGAPMGAGLVVGRKRFESDMAAIWEKSVSGTPERVPLLDNGTFVLPLADGVHRIRSDGQELPILETNFRPNLVSADAKGTLCGFVETPSGLSLAVLSLEARWSVPLASIALTHPIQPPVLLPDGRILVVARDRVVCIESFSIAWMREFANGDVLVTGTLDNYAIVRSGCELRVLDRNGNEAWGTVTPRREPICTNPLLMSDGRICVGTATAIHCYGD